MLKRRYGESLKARRYRNQVKEIKVKLVIYNIDRAVLKFRRNYNSHRCSICDITFMFVQIEVFYKAKNVTQEWIYEFNFGYIWVDIRT
ncbi:MAG: hypothetical protein QMC85_05195 [Methanocellales archaeon]|nr:hypothetical protein [Methanocellales archaeon]